MDAAMKAFLRTFCSKNLATRFFTGVEGYDVAKSIFQKIGCGQGMVRL
jgi:hypothetical protein